MLSSHAIGRYYSEYGMWVAILMLGVTVVQAIFLVFIYHRVSGTGYAEQQDDVQGI